MGTVLRCVQACLLAAMGIFMVAFARSEAYWRLLNPKYSWLTFLAGAVILLVGAGVFLHRERRARPSEILAIAVFLCLAPVALLGPNPFVGQAPAPGAAGEADEMGGRYAGGYVGGSLTLHFDDEAVPPPEVVAGGETYTRMNLAELLAGEEGGWVENGGRYAVQGMVFRTPEMDAAGYIGIGRLYVYCCLADAVNVAALVRVDHPEAYRAGAWVRVLGVLREGSPFPDLTLRAVGALSTARSERRVLQSVEVKETAVEGVPFILGIKEDAPFEY